MIFKTIDDDSALFGQRIVSIFNARKIAQEQAIMQLEVDIACLKQYEVACQSGTVATEQFDSIMEKSSVSAQQYAINIQNGTGSAKAYTQAQKANNVALQSVGTGAGIASKERNMQWNDLCNGGLSVNTPTKFSHNRTMNTDNIDKVSEYLKVQPIEIME